jgi:hypothetical protein
MFKKCGKRGLARLLMFVVVTAWSMGSLAAVCPTGTKQYIVGGSYLCVAITTNGVDADITLRDGGTWPTNIASFTTAVNPTSPLACGGTHDDDCDDIKEAEHEEKNSLLSATATVAPVVVAPVLPPSGLVSCSLPYNLGATPGDDFVFVNVPANTVVSLFSGSSSVNPGTGPWIVKSTALDVLNNTNTNYTLLKSICNTVTYPNGFVSEPKDYVPCDLKSKVNAQITGATKPAKATTLTCSLPANQCTGVLGDLSLVTNDLGLIGLPDGTYDSDLSPNLKPMAYNCQ